MFKKIIGIMAVISLLLFIGCGIVDGVPPPSSTNFGKLPSNYKTQIKENKAKSLKDPYSARFIFGKPFRGYLNNKNDGALFWKGMVVPYSLNAKNSYGGYIGITSYVALFNTDGTYLVSQEASLMARMRKY